MAYKSRREREKDLYSLIRKYFRNGEYQNVISIFDKYLEVSDEYSIYYQNVKFMKARSLRFLKNYEEAIKLLKVSLEEIYDSYCALELFSIYYYLGRYEEALEIMELLYNDPNKPIANQSLYIAELIMKKHLGLPLPKNKNDDKLFYLRDQIINYNNDLAVEHIKQHFEKQEEEYHVCFKSNIDIEYLMECVKENIKNSSKIISNEICEIHYFLVSNIGYNNNGNCNILKVILIPNTNNIITMYPIENFDNEVSSAIILDCDYEKLFKKEEKIKTISRIDKFNKRYNF